VLGANEAVLAALRAAGGGLAIETPLDPWRHDLTATDRFTELWPLLLVLALLLWPLDIALRRMSLGRRELAAARGWVRDIGRRRRATGRRTVTGESLLAARERAGSSEARAAIRGAPEPGPAPLGPSVPDPSVASELVTSARVTSGKPIRSAPASAAASAAPPPAPTNQPTAGPPRDGATALPADTIERLRDAKRRARER
jgi:Ca-activated chloride channel homolog